MRGAIVRVTKEENACPWDTNTAERQVKKRRGRRRRRKEEVNRRV